MLELFCVLSFSAQVIVTYTTSTTTTHTLTLSLFLARFFDRYKNGTPCAGARVALSRFVCSVLGGSVSLCALLIFLPPPRVCVCVRFALRALCVSAIDSLQTHTHARALAHTLIHIHADGKRDTPRKWVEERVGEKITSYINA